MSKDQIEKILERIDFLEKLANEINENKAPLDWVCQQLKYPLVQARKDLVGRFEK